MRTFESFPGVLKAAMIAVPLACAGCETAPKKSPTQALNAAFAAMNKAVAADIDDGDHQDMEAARERYRSGVNLLKTNPDQALEAAEDSEVLAQYAQASVVARLAADNAMKVKKEVADLKRIAKGGEAE